MNCEMRAAVVCVELEISNWIRQRKAARLPHTLVVILKAGHDVLDCVANAIVVSNKAIPDNVRQT